MKYDHLLFFNKKHLQGMFDSLVKSLEMAFEFCVTSYIIYQYL